MRLAASVLAIGLACAACSEGAPDEFDQRLAQWEETAPENYSFTLFLGTFFGGTSLELAVRSGVLEILSEETDGPSVGAEGAATIDEMFDLLRTAYADADTVRAVYDEDYGFPVDVRVDWVSEAVDDESWFEITDFVAE